MNLKMEKIPNRVLVRKNENEPIRIGREVFVEIRKEFKESLYSLHIGCYIIVWRDRVFDNGACTE